MSLQDKIGRDEIVDKICGLVGSLKKEQNFCLAINGAWGSGKSFVLGLIEEKLSKNRSISLLNTTLGKTRSILIRLSLFCLV